jgi:hypothetical protein
VRWIAVNKYGSLNERRQTFFPVYDFSKQDLLNLFEEHKIKLAVDYHMFGRSFDGIDYRFVSRLKRYLPEDYERIKAFFPMIDLDMFRMECREKYHKEHPDETENKK